MGKLWKDMTNEELHLNLKGLRWALTHKCHCLVRVYGRKRYVVPQICTEAFFEKELQQGYLDAQEEIKRLLKERGASKAPTYRMQLMTDEECKVRSVGWKAYIKLTRLGLEFAGRNTK